ncbi:hypothetical protein K502DRAFT_105836 [Neoconidiobolus thromboides FSU 785]|nr:hypothetical protein K502DRAFT_105836 [Neoconidiobolus thromboides FSU 785]
MNLVSTLTSNYDYINRLGGIQRSEQLSEVIKYRIKTIRDLDPELIKESYLIYDSNLNYQGLVYENKVYIFHNEDLDKEHEFELNPISATCLVCFIYNSITKKLGLISISINGYLKYWSDIELCCIERIYNSTFETELNLNKDEEVEYLLSVKHYGILLNTTFDLIYINVDLLPNSFSKVLFSKEISVSFRDKFGQLIGFNNKKVLANIEAYCINFNNQNNNCYIHVCMNNLILTFELNLYQNNSIKLVDEYNIKKDILNIQKQIENELKLNISYNDIIILDCSYNNNNNNNNNNQFVMLIKFLNNEFQHLILLTFIPQNNSWQFVGFKILFENEILNNNCNTLVKLFIPNNEYSKNEEANYSVNNNICDTIIIQFYNGFIITTSLPNSEQYFVPIKKEGNNLLLEVNDSNGKSSNCLATLNHGFLIYKNILNGVINSHSSSYLPLNFSENELKNLLIQAIEFYNNENNCIDYQLIIEKSNINPHHLNLIVSDLLTEVLEPGKNIITNKNNCYININ